MLGVVLPEVRAWLFGAFPAQGALLAAFYWMGLILLMFVATGDPVILGAGEEDDCLGGNRFLRHRGCDNLRGRNGQHTNDRS